MKLIALILFITSYVLILLLPKHRAVTALSAAALFVCTGILTPAGAWKAIDWNVLLTLAGMMGMVTLFIRSQAPAWLADTLAGATLGGNLAPVGASANIAAAGILRKEDYPVSNREFMRIGVPFTLAAVVTGYVLIWVLYR